MKKLFLLTLITSILCVDFATAQQDPQYTQYMYNQNVVNPAYAGLQEGLALGLLYRNQWSALDGAPETFTFNAHAPVGERTGLGISIIRDELGPVKETNAYVDFSYTIPVSNNYQLAFGLKAGATFHDIGLADLELQDPGDPFFSQNVSQTTPNIGAGVFLYSDNFYFGASVPNILSSLHLDENGLQFGSETSHYFVTSGYVFQATENIKLKPSVLVKSAFDAPTSFDVNFNALFLEKFELGVSYRLDDSFSGIVGFQATPDLRIGYAYDAVVSEINNVAPSSHEIILTYNIIFNKRALRSPRYF
ncbi:membrane protein [Dokdonia pacifica]|uniref:Type IX secretion system membrane protein, PorP/SprF family n=1 Tax=Dokdonia pacifica TaxID=1627892 RepID=A0A238W142_9FLAO|nr:type IX secretion system membrane protein PorP/SprF [Dokdonia pacifica]GGG15812.1 membrane protein [Dokdonia pacifica]SNR40280.1 type IX secretion system membrane protein, PorP/SprF family [Dokdonia pacifica]